MARVFATAVRKVPSLRDTYPALNHIGNSGDPELHIRGWYRGATNLLYLCMCAERVWRMTFRALQGVEFQGHRWEISEAIEKRISRMASGTPPPSVLGLPLKLHWNLEEHADEDSSSDSTDSDSPSTPRADISMVPLPKFTDIGKGNYWFDDDAAVVDHVEDAPATEHHEGDRARTPPTVADGLFLSAFARGWLGLEVSGNGLLCGIRAMIESIEAQLDVPISPIPMEQDLLDIHQSHTVQAINEELGEERQNNTANFSVDQLGAILYNWGTNRGLNLRLGYRLLDGRCFLIGTPKDHEDSVKTIWISSSSHSGVTSGDGTDHYDGIEPVTSVHEGDEGELDEDPTVSLECIVVEGVDPEDLTSTAEHVEGDPAPVPGVADVPEMSSDSSSESS